jgi:hypothetical protein
LGYDMRCKSSIQVDKNFQVFHPLWKEQSTNKKLPENK